jgi:phosphoglycolate phosphatase
MTEGKLVVFDFDGVIAEGFDQQDDFFLQKYQGLTAKYNLAPILDGPGFAQFTKLGTWEQIKYSKVKMHRLPSLIWEVGSMIQDSWSKAVTYEQIEETLHDLSQIYVLVIASRNYSFIINKFLKKYGLRRYFKQILGRNHNPDKAKNLQVLLRKYKVLPEQAVLITDTSKDLLDAQKCRMRAIAVTYGLGAKPDLEKLKPDCLVDSPSQIPKAVRQVLG